ncbi:MAG TPA: GNAT family N-acetyltransferase [Casimicrobiaceae bacterium]|nr:GNAT family N-acetyltransferase [Casimicrobiaceae bacterium]
MKRSDVGVREATEADLDAIVAIYSHHVRTGTASFEIDAPGGAEMARRWRELVDRGLPYLVAVAGSGVVGYAYAAPYRPRPAYRFTVEDSVYVRADFARRGVGATLLAELVSASQRAGARQMIAVIGDSANVASIRLHAAAGFTKVGALASVGWKFERWLDVVIMQRALGPGNALPAG